MAWWNYKVRIKTWFFNTWFGLSCSIILLLDMSLFGSSINFFVYFICSNNYYLSSSFKTETYFSNMSSLYLSLIVISACSWQYFSTVPLVACRNLFLYNKVLHGILRFFDFLSNLASKILLTFISFL